MTPSLEEISATLRSVVREELARLLAARPVEVPPAAETRLLGVDEAARHLGLSRSTLYKRAQRCEVPSIKDGNRVLFRVTDLDTYAEARRRSPERVRNIADRALKGG